MSEKISALKRTLVEKSLEGSYTLEATIVMVMVLFVVSSVIITSYRWRNQTVGCVKLQEMTEILRHTEEEDLPEGAQLNLSAPSFHLSARYAGNQVLADGSGDGWSLSIETKRFNPEDFLRMVSLIVE